MKNLITACAALIFSISASTAKITPPEISRGELAPSTIFTTYRSLPSARDNVSTASENYTSLSGEWKIKRYENQADLTVKGDVAGWGTIALPLAWQMAGRGTAIFSQKAYPFLKNESEASALNPNFSIKNSESYVLTREFTVPFDYLDKVLYLTIGASSARTTLYINGKEVGMSTDSRSAAQFNVSKFVERGLNTITMKIDDYCTASLIEDQAAWRLAGANREVYLMAQPKIRMRDYLVRTSLDPTYTNGLLETALLLKSELLNPHEVTVFYDLYDRQGKIVNQASRQVMIGMRGEDTVRFTATIMGVERWSAETPSLYTLIYRVKREGRFTEYIARKVGFRNVEIKGNKLTINGVAEQIRGVNLEEFDPSTGNVMNPEVTKSELLKMKQLGLNAIRTGGYPLPPFFYEMTDSLGFYVVSTANVNASGMSASTALGGTLANDPAWRDVFVDRAISTYEHGKNYPSVVAFALGEQAGNGYCMYEAYLAIKARDANRVVIYDGAKAEWNTDIVCPIDPTIEELEKIAQVEPYKRITQPIIPARVKFDPKYWKLAHTQGAFIDRWVAPSIERTGVEFASLSDDYKLTSKTNGTIRMSSAADHLTTIGEIFAPVRLTPEGKSNTYTIENRLQSTNLNHYKVECYKKSLLGKAQWVELPAIECAAGESAQITLPAGVSKLKIGNILSLEL